MTHFADHLGSGIEEYAAEHVPGCNEGCEGDTHQLSPADYTTCIGCGDDFAPPNGTDLCGACCKPEVSS
jgi:hypothetical protein